MPPSFHTSLAAVLALGADQGVGIAGPAWAPHAVALFAFASGIALWLAGRRYLRAAFVLAGSGIGALSGFEALHALGPSLNPLIGAGAGFVLGALLGLVAFRFVVALSLGGIGALASVLVALGAFNAGLIKDGLRMDHNGAALRSFAEDAGRALAPLALSEDSTPRDAFVGPVLSDAAVNLAGNAAERARLFFASLTQQAAPIWNDLPTERRMTLSAAGVVGLILGALAGFLLPSRAAAVSTSFIGPAIWLPIGLYLLSALGVPVESWAPARPLVWLGVWLALAGAGLLVQWTRHRPTADKA